MLVLGGVWFPTSESLKLFEGSVYVGLIAPGFRTSEPAEGPILTSWECYELRLMVRPFGLNESGKKYIYILSDQDFFTKIEAVKNPWKFWEKCLLTFVNNQTKCSEVPLSKQTIFFHTNLFTEQT